MFCEFYTHIYESFVVKMFFLEHMSKQLSLLSLLKVYDYLKFLLHSTRVAVQYAG